MRRLVLALICAAGATTLDAVQPSAPDVLTSTLRRAGERVEHFFRRAQSLVCLEIVHLQPLNFSMTSTGLGRTVESDSVCRGQRPARTSRRAKRARCGSC